MPFGLCNAPVTFELPMDNVLCGLKCKTCLCYLDDIVVFSQDFAIHLKRLEQELTCLAFTGLQRRRGMSTLVHVRELPFTQSSFPSNIVHLIPRRLPTSITPYVYSITEYLARICDFTLTFFSWMPVIKQTQQH